MTNFIPVFLHASDEYAPMCAVTIVSILENTNQFIKFYITETDISDFHKRQIESLGYKNYEIIWRHFEYDDVFKFEYLNSIRKDNLKNPAWPGIHAFFTPFIPYIDKSIDKAIYIDTDAILLDDIKLFYEQGLEGKTIGVVPDCVCPLFVSKAQKKLNKNICYDEYGEYFCAGVLILNCKKFRDDNLIKKYFEIASLQRVPVCDQDVLNILCYKDKKILSQKFNVIYQPEKQLLQNYSLGIDESEFKEASIKAVIRHYADFKPWKLHGTEWINQRKFYNVGDWWYYASKTPFYPGLKQETLLSVHESLIKIKSNKFAASNHSATSQRKNIRWIYIFGLKVLKIEETNLIKKVKLFGVFTLFKEFK